MNKLSFKAYSDGGANNMYHNNGYGSFRIFYEDIEVAYQKLKFEDARTSNEAEYMTMLSLLRFIRDYSKENKNFFWTVYADSKLVVKQLTKKYQVNAENLIGLNREGKELLNEIKNIEIVWVPRKEIVKILGH